MTKTWLILIYISSLLRDGGTQPLATIEISGVKIADNFFEYELCKTDGAEELQGQAWTCFVPGECKTGEMAGGLFRDTVGLKDCHALLAIQSRDSDHFRIVIQIQTDKVSINTGVQFVYNDKVEIDCTVDVKKIVMKKQGNGDPFEIVGEKSSYARFDNKQFMCETIVHFKEASTVSTTRRNGETTGIKWKNNVNVEQSATKLISVIVPEIDASKKCNMEFLKYHEPENVNNEDFKRINMDRNTMTCPTGYVIRMRNNAGANTNDAVGYLAYSKLKCSSSVIQFTDLQGNGPIIKSVTMDTHCMQKKCKQCAFPPELCEAGSTCPTLKPNEEDHEVCAQLKCPAGMSRFLVGGVANTAEPVCDAQSLKWTLSGAEFTKIKCGKDLTCEPADGAVKVKDGEREKVDVTETLVKCKDGNMSYTTAEKEEVKLLEVACNVSVGKWYETRVAPSEPGIYPYQDTSVLECKVEGGAILGAATAGTTLKYACIALGIVAVIAAIIIILLCCCKRRKKARETEALKHKLASKESKSKESKSKESKTKSNVPSSSGGVTGVPSSDKSQTLKKSKKDLEKVSLGIDTEEAKTAISKEDKSNPKTGVEIKDEERSNPTERSAIPKTEDLKNKLKSGDAKADKKKTALATAALLESSKNQDESEAGEGGPGSRIDTALLARKGIKTRNLDGTQAGTSGTQAGTTMNPDGTPGTTLNPDGTPGTTMNADGTQGPSSLNPDGTQAQTLLQQQQEKKKRAATRKGTFMDTAMGADPTRGADGTQQPSENGPDEGGTQMPTNGTNDTQAATGRPGQPKTKGRRTQPTQAGGGEGDDDEAEQPMWPQEAATAVEKTDELGTGLPRDATATRGVRTTQDGGQTNNTQNATRTKMHTAADADQSAVMEPEPDGLKTGREKKEGEHEEDDDPLNTAVGKKDRQTVEKHTAKEKEDEAGESAKKVKSKKQRPSLKPREMELNEKEKKIKAGAKRNRNDYPTMRDIESDWDSDKDKVSSRSSKKSKKGSKKSSRRSKIKDQRSEGGVAGTQHSHGSEAGCGPLCMPMSPAKSVTDTEEN